MDGLLSGPSEASEKLAPLNTVPTAPSHPRCEPNVPEHTNAPLILEVADDQDDYVHRVRIHGAAAGGLSSMMFARVDVHKRDVGGAAKKNVLSKCAVVLDLGGLSVPPEAVNEPGELLALVTHCHMDHCSGLVALAGARDLKHSSALADKAKMKARRHKLDIVPVLPNLRVLLPDGPAIGMLQQVLELYGRMGEEDGNPDHVALHGVSPGEQPTKEVLGELGMARPGERQRCVLPFRTMHPVPSCGYVVVSRIETIKPALLLDAHGAPLQGRDYGARRQSLGEQIQKGELLPDEVFDVREVAEIAYTGDTTAAWLDEPNVSTRAVALALSAKVLVTEATFLKADDVHIASQRGHTHISELAARADRFRHTGALVLTHFSTRSSRREIKDALHEQLPPELAAKTHALVLEGFHGSGGSRLVK